MYKRALSAQQILSENIYQKNGELGLNRHKYRHIYIYIQSERERERVHAYRFRFSYKSIHRWVDIYSYINLCVIGTKVRKLKLIIYVYLY